MAAYTVWIVAPEGDHWRGLEHAAGGIVHALRTLGHGVSFASGTRYFSTIQQSGGRLVVFNAHRLHPDDRLPDDAILYNAEQVPVRSERLPVMTSPGWELYIERLQRYVVWDYCDANIERLRAFGVGRLVKCPIGYWPGLATVPPCANEDVDVLFVGSMNDRRQAALEACRRRGLKVSALFDCYGATRDEWMARAKIILNVHYYPSPIFEIFRVSHALANRKCVVSESGGVDAELEAFATRATWLTDYDDLGDVCRRLVDNGIERKACAESGYAEVRRLDQVTAVQVALEQY